MLEKNVSPYFDTFDADNKFYQVMFRPSYAIQARELNELQSQLQNQITQFGAHVFKEGSLVIPGTLTISAKNTQSTINYVKIESTFAGQLVSSYIDSVVASDAILTGSTTGVKAQIIHYDAASDTDPTTIYVRYISSGTDNVTKVFAPGEDLITDEVIGRSFTVGASGTEPTGIGAVAHIQRGVYFVRGKFVLVEPQVVTLSRYTDTPSCRVGLLINEKFVTPEENETLLDNSIGSNNYAAPGAHRHYIELMLISVDADYASPDFVELASIDSGSIKTLVNNSQYSILAETMARRTYDESGNYTVSAFPLEIRESRDNNRGEFLANTKYNIGDVVKSAGNYYAVDTAGTSGSVAPTHTFGSVSNGGAILTFTTEPKFNNGVYVDGDADYFTVGVGAGKAYVYGFEVTNQSTRYINVPKARTFDSARNAAIPSSIGQYIKVSGVFGAVNSTEFDTVDLYSGTVTTGGVASGTRIGTANVKYMEYDSGVIGSATYVMSLFNIQIDQGKTFEDNVRSIYKDNTGGVDFTANIEKIYSVKTGTISANSANANVLGIGTKFTTELAVGQTISYTVASVVYTAIIANITTDTTLTLTANAPITATTVNYSRVSVSIYGSEFGLFSPIPNASVRKIRDLDNESISNTSYYTRQKFIGTVSAGSITINTSVIGETFGSPSQPDAFIVVDTTTGTYLNPTITLSGSLNSALISGLTNGHNISVVATVRRVMKEKTKTLIRSATTDFITVAGATANKLTLSNVDGYALVKVVSFVDTATGNPIPFGSAIPSSGVTEVDITTNYVFSNGQTETYYGFASASLKSGSSYPNSPIRVVYDHFGRGSSGDYYSVDSYYTCPVSIPKFIKSNGTEVNLRNVLDFRPDQTSVSSFAGSLSVANGFDIIADYSYYLPRIDVVYADSLGNFGVVNGAPSLNPTTPKEPANSMILYRLGVSAYTEDAGYKSVSIGQVDNRRYTMQDIGKIDRRLQNVEYYTALNLLEQQTNNLQLFDKDGNLNFKNGFIVDPLSGINIADIASTEFRCSIDPMQQECHPEFAIENVGLIEDAVTNADRLAKGYVNNSGIVTLPYAEAPYIIQPYASHQESITPFLQLSFVGDIALTPSSDEWYETALAPAIVINAEGNFSAIEAANRNILGTVWGSWQTNWTSSSTATTNTDLLSRWGSTVGFTDWFGGTNETIVTTTTTEGQSRSGTNTYVQAVFETKVIDDRIIAVDLIPTARSRDILFKAVGLKSFTKVTPFFDSVNVAAHTTSDTVIIFASKTRSFDTVTSAGANGEQSARLTNGKTTTALSIGDVVHNGAGGNINLATATAVVTYDGDLDIRVVNVKGAFSNGQTVYGSISGAIGVISSVSSSGLVTNGYGEVSGVFTIPATNALKFSTGQRAFSLSDSTTNGEDYTTRATSTFSSAGYLQTHQQTILSTRNGVVAQRLVSDSRTVTSQSSFVQPPPVISPWSGGCGGGSGGDPLAQSFTVDNIDGIFVTSVDVYFASKDRISSMWFYITEMNTGLPTNRVVPGSRVTLNPSQITVTPNSAVPTRITFQYPVYLSGTTEYAFVLGSDSTNFSVWVSQVGKNDILTNGRISRQPYLGSAFKSQNAITWNPDQLLDIKFVINRAKFDTSRSGIPTLTNTNVPEVSLAGNPIQTKQGLTTVRVFAKNHGLVSGDFVTISGAVASNGLLAEDINKQHTVVSSEIDSFVITLANAATITGYAGGASIKISRNINFDIANLLTTQFAVNNTGIKHFIQPVTDAYVKQTKSVEVTPNDNFHMPKPMVVASKENEVAKLAGVKSLSVYSELVSKSDFVSPVIDLHRTSLAAIGNRINSPSGDLNVTGLDDVALFTSSLIAFADNKITSTDVANIKKIKIGRYITISGSVANNGTYLVTDVSDDNTLVTVNGTFTTEVVGAAITVTQKERFVSEIAPEYGSSDYKYIIKEMTLSLPANQLTVYFDANKPSVANVDLYYRVVETASSKKISDVKWSKILPSTPIVSVDNASSYSGAVYSISTPVDFVKAQIKIVSTSPDTSKVPVLKNIRMIATS